VCCGPTPAYRAVCFACRSVARRLGVPLAPVFAVAPCALPGALYTVLLGYKESPVAEARRRFAPMVRRLFEGFLGAHAGCLATCAGGRLHLAVPVPSTARASGAPLAAVPGLRTAVEGALEGCRWSPGALVRAEAAVGHMRPDAAAFRVPAGAGAGVVGRRILLLDDTYVTGARAQSAAAALRRAGARAVVIVALGRVVRPDRSELHRAYLGRNDPGPGSRGWAQPGRCCRCVQTTAWRE
jgi:hypothetical protein